MIGCGSADRREAPSLAPSYSTKAPVPAPSTKEEKQEAVTTEKKDPVENEIDEKIDEIRRDRTGKFKLRSLLR